MQTSFLGTAWSRKFPIVAVLKTTHTVHCKDKFVVENKNFGMTKVSILQAGSKMTVKTLIHKPYLMRSDG